MHSSQRYCLRSGRFSSTFYVKIPFFFSSQVEKIQVARQQFKRLVRETVVQIRKKNSTKKNSFEACLVTVKFTDNNDF